MYSNVHVFDKMSTESCLVLLPSAFVAVQEMLGWLLVGPLISPETTFFLFLETKLKEDGKVSFPSMVQPIEALGDASAWQTHFSTSPIRWQKDSGRITGASRKRKTKMLLF